MAEARQLKAGRWRIYVGPHLALSRDPATGSIATFKSLAEARAWWGRLHLGQMPLRESPKCARCGGYFGPGAEPIPDSGQLFHLAHRPELELRLRA